MVDIQVNLPIGSEQENKWLAMWGEDPVFFSLETVKRIFDEHPDEQEFRFNFNCDGGYVEEGLAIYDAIRTSGKTIYCNIEGGCHSMAVVMLLAAPAENRTANPNCRALIHNVSTDIFQEGMTAEELQRIADDMKQDEAAILDIYADRTGYDREQLQELMNEQKVRNASWLLEHGFISKINAYNTNMRKHRSNSNNNKNLTTMAKTKEQVMNEANSFMSRLKNLLGVEAKNFEHTDADGNVLFSTELEDDHLEVGLNATPDGSFTLAAATSEYPEGTVVVVADGKITEINEPANESEKELEEANKRISELENALQEAQTTIQDLMAQVSSNKKPANAKRDFTPANNGGKSVEEYKNAMREARK